MRTQLGTRLARLICSIASSRMVFRTEWVWKCNCLMLNIGRLLRVEKSRQNDVDSNEAVHSTSSPPLLAIERGIKEIPGHANFEPVCAVDTPLICCFLNSRANLDTRYSGTANVFQADSLALSIFELTRASINVPWGSAACFSQTDKWPSESNGRDLQIHLVRRQSAIAGSWTKNCRDYCASVFGVQK